MKNKNTMSLIKKLTDRQIHEIADAIDIGEICYLNGDTGEYIIMLNNEMLADNGIYWEDAYEEEEEEEKEVSEFYVPKWQEEMQKDVKADMDKINSWEHVIKIEKPDSHKAFGFMERFVDDVIPEGRLKEDFWRALSRNHPFSKFNDIVHDCDYRENWFAFKQNALKEYVKKKIIE